MINKWALISLFLMIVSPLYLIVYGFSPYGISDISIVVFFGITTLIGLAMAISNSRQFFVLRSIDKMLEDTEPKKKKQKRCKVCGTYLTYVTPLNRSEQKRMYVCYKCNRQMQ